MNSTYLSEAGEESNYWNWNGFKIFWSVKGKENTHPMILLHGFGASSKHWRNNSCYFAKKGYSVYSIDLIGFGNSAQPGISEIEKLDNGVWCNQVSDFIKQVIRPQTSKKIVLIGNSLGSLVALTCAVYLKNEILSVVASPLPDPLLIRKKEPKINLIFEKFKTNLIKIFFKLFPLEIFLFLINKLGIIKLGLNAAYFKKDNVDKELIDIVRKPVLRKTAARSLRAMCIGMLTRGNKLKATYLLEQLSYTKKVPFLLLWGEKDNFIPLFLGKKIANFHRWVELKIIPNSGHCVHDEDPSLFNKISHEWIRDLKTF
ncbi:predicted alpha/beta hydrolase superfamily protein [Prochlorococcus marinus str. MIT 9515]|uniref:Predicted alpha/beta hydrolase superfamily protein n=1 Tax=Prochlorococcus marinus (strain MIT 9515) TaxID=167542 RepID=A2BXL6_PROM5|nr:alpha/beta fold hydrolase [Prochlorococcus marinus]ABM72527.1 predicted alpha/beta hydrolase superfamily protein [Prochlorococcus marinus str. MIT 9515]